MDERFDLFWNGLDQLWQANIEHGLGNEYSLRGRVPTSFEEFDKVESLSVSHGNLDVLRYFKNLMRLSATQVEIEDYTQISNIVGLKTLNLANSSLENLRFILPLQQLTTLNISRTKVEDLEPLTELPKLSTLDISYTSTNMEPLTRCKNLKTLLANNCGFFASEVIGKLKKLKVLGIKNNQLDNLDFLGNLNNLECVWFTNVDKGVYSPSCKDGDLSVLRKLPKLQQIGCSPVEFAEIKFWFSQTVHFDVAGKEYVVENSSQYTLAEYKEMKKNTK